MTRSSRTLGVFGLFVALLVLTGCDSGPKVVRVSGKLTRGGKPVPNLMVNFMPESGRPSWGLADENGKFTLEYDDVQKGAIVGQHTVWVQWRPANPDEESGIFKGKSSKPADYKDIAEKYGSEEKTPLKIEIAKAESDLEIKLD